MTLSLVFNLSFQLHKGTDSSQIQPSLRGSPSAGVTVDFRCPSPRCSSPLHPLPVARPPRFVSSPRAPAPAGSPGLVQVWTRRTGCVALRCRKFRLFSIFASYRLNDLVSVPLGTCDRRAPKGERCSETCFLLSRDAQPRTALQWAPRSTEQGRVGRLAPAADGACLPSLS